MNQAWAGHPGHLAVSSTSSFKAPVAHGAECSCCDDLSKCDQESFPEWQIWVKPLGNGRTAVYTVNISEKELNITAPLKDLGVGNHMDVYCVWCHKHLYTFTDDFKIDQLASHDSRLFILTAAA